MGKMRKTTVQKIRINRMTPKHGPHNLEWQKTLCHMGQGEWGNLSISMNSFPCCNINEAEIGKGVFVQIASRRKTHGPPN
jgi:hypothetical protein